MFHPCLGTAPLSTKPNSAGIYMAVLQNKIYFAKNSEGLNMLIFHTKGAIRRPAVEQKGSGIVNTLINKLPIELHIPGYKFCGPGTRLKERLERGERGINLLDDACKAHDIAYSQTSDLEKRHEADRILAKKAWERVRSKDASVLEKTAALAVTGIMKGKTKLGMGGSRKKGCKNKCRRKIGMGALRRKRRRERRTRIRKRFGGAMSFRRAVSRARTSIKGTNDVMRACQLALGSINKRKISAPKTRIITIPKRGGFLPLIPIFSALSALGSLGGGAAAVVKAVADAKNAAKGLKEKERHNRAMEPVSLGKGLHLGPYKRGLGLYLAPYQSKNFPSSYPTAP